MTYAQKIQEKLETALDCAEIHVRDQSHLHEGHAGAKPGGETHFKVVLVSPNFTKLSRIQRHKLVHAALEDELNMQIHALTLDLKAPGE